MKKGNEIKYSNKMTRKVPFTTIVLDFKQNSPDYQLENVGSEPINEGFPFLAAFFLQQGSFDIFRFLI